MDFPNGECQYKFLWTLSCCKLLHTSIKSENSCSDQHDGHTVVFIGDNHIRDSTNELIHISTNL
jgi:hypothetical protein